MIAPAVLIRDGAGLFAFRGMAPPMGALGLFDRIASVAGMMSLPLAWLAAAGGRGGFFRGDLVAVGEADVCAMAGAIHAQSGGRTRLGDAYAAVVRVLLAHEIGHALQARLGLVDRGAGSEEEADLAAGWIAEALGFPEDDDAAVLDAAGSRAVASSHPAAATRVSAYREGRRMRRARWERGAAMDR
ncbi:MAG: hypothetical protein QM820_30825 [Minicystis sp.]